VLQAAINIWSKRYAIERIEVRAFGCLLEELVEQLDEIDLATYPEVVEKIRLLQHACCLEETAQRPLFSIIQQRIQKIEMMLQVSLDDERKP